MEPAEDACIKDHATEFMDDAEALGIEDEIWWAVGRRSILRRSLQKAARRGVRSIAEIGCGSGGDLSLLARYAPVYGVERSRRLADRARKRDVARAIYTTDVFEQPLPDVDLYCMFDVLEHIEDDDDFLRRLAAKGGPGHQLLLTVPACQFLFGPHDELLHHFRRYSQRQLIALLEKHGYVVDEINHFMFFLFPVAVASRLWDAARSRLGRPRRDVELGRVPPAVNSTLISILDLEARLSRWVRFPIGLWIAVLAHRPAA